MSTNLTGQNTVDKLKVNEIFYTLQGEGYHVGVPSIFIRLSDCNLRCTFCDTEFLSGKMMTLEEIVTECQSFRGTHIVLTGGEPGAQDIGSLVQALKRAKYYIQIETNGMFKLPWGIDWVTCAPKTKPQSLNVEFYHEIKLVVNNGDKLPKLGSHKDRYNYPVNKKLCWVSPQNPLDHTQRIGLQTSSSVDNDNLNYCIGLIKNNPDWRLNTQQHKYWRID